MSKLHDDREVGPEVLPGAPGESEGAGSALAVGDRVAMTGEIVVASSAGEPWFLVRLDGVKRHVVACWKSDVRPTQHKSPDPGNASRGEK